MWRPSDDFNSPMLDALFDDVIQLERLVEPVEVNGEVCTYRTVLTPKGRARVMDYRLRESAAALEEP